MPDQGSTYASFLEGALKAERERRAALDSRATSVVTASAAFVTLVVALVAWILGKDYRYVTSGATYIILIALAFFIASSVCALIAGQLREYEVPDPETLRLFLSSRWTDTEVTARNNCGWLNLDTLSSLRVGNHIKAWWLDWALRLQALAVLALSVAVGWELLRR